MKWSTQVAIGLILCGASIAGQITAKSEGGNGNYTQIVIPFPGERPFTYEWQKSDNTLVLRFPQSSPEELEAINHYDERLVRRVLIKDQSPQGTEVRLVLRDRDVRAVVTTLKDPFRVSLDLFDRTYSEPKDPESGLPLTSRPSVDATTTATVPATTAPAPMRMMEAAKPINQQKAAQEDATPKRKLMQPTPIEINSPNELKSMMAKIEPGTGKSWVTYPPYIYRMQLAPYEGREAPTGETSPLQVRALTTSNAMAEYASKLFDFGHEGRALVAYQQVLQREPEVFERDAIHLWKFAEAHLGQGNLTLADGYYQTLIEKHPDHMMARFARLRKLDTRVIKAISEGEPDKLPMIAEQLDSLPTRDNAELNAMIAIRKAWWNDKNIDQKSRKELPACSEETEQLLSRLAPKIENPRTAYLASALIARRLTAGETPWQNQYATWLSTFFNRYKSAPNAIVKDELIAATKKKITDQFQDLFRNNQYVEVVNLYNQLPAEMKSIAKDPGVSWQLAESYRAMGQQDQAIGFYKTAAGTNASVDRFKATFWLGALATKRASELAAAGGNQARIKALETDAKNADGVMSSTWNRLKSDEKSVLITALMAPMQEVVASDSKMRTPPRIILEQYKSALVSNPPKMNATNGTATTDWLGNFSPSGATVRLLDDLGRKFAELGMTNERRQALELMKFLKPSQFDQDKEAAKLWELELTKLAEEHRKADEFLEAGELYTLVGDSTLQAENRAEALYKGGLLLFRAGKKQDAINALEKAKADTSNLFYSKLATERLDQIETK